MHALLNAQAVDSLIANVIIVIKSFRVYLFNFKIIKVG